MVSAGLLLAQGAGTTPPTPGQRAQNRFNRIADLLNLTADQRTQIQTIMQGTRTQAQALRPQMQGNRQDLMTLIKSGSSGADFDSKLQALANTQGSLMSQMTVIHAKAMAQVWALLTPDQQQKAGDLFGLMHGGFGMGGPGGPGMMGHGMGMRGKP